MWESAYDVIWYRWVADGALTDVQKAQGYSAAPTFQKVSIRALITFTQGGMRPYNEQFGIGQLHDVDMSITTDVALGENDEIEWDGRRYRIESPSFPNKTAGTFTAFGKRV